MGARCLWALAELEGREPAELRPLLRRVADLFTSSMTGWINDAHDPLAQYDIYSPDMYLLAEPFAERLGSAWRTGFGKVINDLDVLAQPGGAVVWGRSVGALSLAMTIADRGHLRGAVNRRVGGTLAGQDYRGHRQTGPMVSQRRHHCSPRAHKRPLSRSIPAPAADAGHIRKVAARGPLAAPLLGSHANFPGVIRVAASGQIDQF